MTFRDKRAHYMILKLQNNYCNSTKLEREENETARRVTLGRQSEKSVLPPALAVFSSETNFRFRLSHSRTRATIISRLSYVTDIGHMSD